MVGLVACIHGGMRQSDDGEVFNETHMPSLALLDEIIYFSQYTPDV